MSGTFQTFRRGIEIGSSKNNVRISHDGELTFKGKGTTWDDIQNSLIGRRLSGTAGTADYNYANNSITFQAGGDIENDGDYVVFNMQYPHKAITDGTLNLHVHWEQVDTTTREFTLWYRIQSNGDVKETDWTEVVVDSNTNNKFEYTSGTLNQITELEHIDMTDVGISAIVQFRFTRSDVVATDMEVLFVDAHYEADGNGSSEEYVK